ncbi:MAG: DNA gyrase subunit A, partial [Bacteroidetes bacterium]|nr:DNA gyrase subunit A [Bacteroidota bacterium]
IIRASKTVEEARNGLIERFQLSDIQARAIVDMRLRALTGLERDKLKDEYDELMKKIEYLKTLLSDKDLRMQIIKDELEEIRSRYGDDRRTEIEYSAEDMSIEDFIADEAVVITISHLGYVKRTALTEYRLQKRGGRGSKGSESRNEDYIEYIFVATNHNYMLFFTEQGKCFWLKVYEIPEGGKNSKGRAIQNLINISPDDKVMAFMNIKALGDEEYINSNFITLCTRRGIIKKTTLEAYSRPRQNGINAITVRDGDQLLSAKLTNGKCELMIAAKSGRAIRFHESTVRPMGRNASGVRGLRLANEDDVVVGMVCIEDQENEGVLVVSENGYGKRSKLEDYRITNRGGKGVKTINVTEKTGCLISIQNVCDEDNLMIINRSGILIRMRVGDLRVMGRATQGVRLINLKGDDAIAAVTKIEVDDMDLMDTEENGEETNGETPIEQAEGENEPQEN